MGWGHYENQAALTELLAPLGLPENATMAVIAIELGGGILVVLGLLARFAGLAMAALTLAAAYFLHYVPGDEATYPLVFAYLSISGGMIYLFSHGAGGFSVDAMITNLDN